MSDQLEQAEVPVVESNEEIAPAHEYSSGEAAPEPIVESATTSEENHEQKSNGVQARFNKMTAEKYELKDQNSQLQRQIEELQKAQPAQAQPEQLAQPVTNAYPADDLQYDNPDEYRRQVDAYNDSRADARFQKQQQDANLQRQQELQVKNAQDMRAGYIAKANQLGVSEDEAFGSIQTLINQGISENLNNVIGHHDKAPAIAAYLAKNPAVFEELNTLSVTNPIGAAQKLLSIEADAVTRNISSAPAPNTNLNGLSAREPDEFDKACPGAVFK